jgi:hypothetical protein
MFLAVQNKTIEIMHATDDCIIICSAKPVGSAGAGEIYTALKLVLSGE